MEGNGEGESDKDGYLEFDENESGDRKKDFSFETIIDEYKVPIAILLLGLILTGLGVFYLRNNDLLGKQKIEVVESATVDEKSQKSIVVEIAGAVAKPGVYTFENTDARVIDLIEKAGGFSNDVDNDWVEKVINKAARLNDGSKYLIRSINDDENAVNDKQTDNESANNFEVYQSGSSILGVQNGNLINVNTATLEELESLPGIGPVYGKSIIEHRPYSTIEELVSKGAIKQFVFEKCKDMITVN